MPQITANEVIFKIYYIVNYYDYVFKNNIELITLDKTTYRLLELNLICNNFNTFYYKILIKIFQVKN